MFNKRKKIKFDGNGSIIIPEYYSIGTLLRFNEIYSGAIYKKDNAIITKINKEEFTITLFWLEKQIKKTYTITEALAKFELVCSEKKT